MSALGSIILISILLGQASQPAGASASSQPTSVRADDPIPRDVQDLVNRLADRSFATREDAQRRLEAMAETAAIHLARFITDPNPEIASRVAAILGTPRDPIVRTELAIRLIESTDPDWMERGVHMLFANPAETGEPFMERTRGEVGIRRVIFEPIREQMASWQRQENMFQRTYARMKEKNPERAEQLRRTHADSRLYCAEAAYWSAYDALLEEQSLGSTGSKEAEPAPSTRPHD